MSNSRPLIGSASVGPGETDLIFGPRGFLQMNTSGQILNQAQFRLNMQKLITSIIGYSKYKEAKYEENNPRKDLQVLRQDLKAQMSLIDTEAKKAGAENIILSDDNMRGKLEDKAKEDSLEKYQATIGNLAKFEAKVNDIRAVLKMFCINYPALSDADKLKTEVNLANRIKDAILNLRSEVSGTSETAVNTRNQIEMILLNFANAWKAFKGSYMLNFCLTGGAGVGKTTLAKAISKCLSAYGILATNYIKEASKTDFIAQYIGQSVHKTDATLYGSLEGVCFIDEAYAIGQVQEYGQEALDELTFFTQKFPGCISIIIAGYEKEMKKHFFDKNEGLNRRFPNRIDLKPYDIDTIQATLVNRVLGKLGVQDPTKRSNIQLILGKFNNVLSMLYADMLEKDSSYTDEISYNYDRLVYFNLYPVYNLILAAGTPSEKKRNILKTYFLKKYCGIPEGDLFPNQMGDVQNIVDFILTTPRVLNPSLGELTNQDILDVFNKYLDMRKIGKLQVGGYVPGDPEAEPWELGSVPKDPPMSWEFTVNGLSTSEMEDKIINSFFAYVVEDPAERTRLRQKGVFTLNATNPKEALIIKQMDKLYTEAVIYLQEYQDAVLDGYQEIKLSTHIDLNFLKQEYSSYSEAQAKDQTGFATISYSNPKTTRREGLGGYESIGKFPELPQEKIADVCKDTSVVVALQQASARDVEAQDDGGRAVGGPRVGAGPRVGGPPAPPPVPPVAAAAAAALVPTIPPPSLGVAGQGGNITLSNGMVFKVVAWPGNQEGTIAYVQGQMLTPAQEWKGILRIDGTQKVGLVIPTPTAEEPFRMITLQGSLKNDYFGKHGWNNWQQAGGRRRQTRKRIIKKRKATRAKKI